MRRARILCVDDEPAVLDGIEQHLRKLFEVRTAASGHDGLEILDSGGPFAVVLSDMRMPGMDGATFLGRAREMAPDTVRMLLTGQADVESAISAVNLGQIFRFLTKPCPPNQLRACFEQALEQHLLITAERQLLEETLHGSIQALSDVLALTSPTSFGRATRIKRHAGALATELGIKSRWEIEVAAMLNQLGFVTLPPNVMDKVYHGTELSESEQAMVDGVPAATKSLLERIPRLESVVEILESRDRPFDCRRKRDVPPVGARVLKIAMDFEALESRVSSPQRALDTMRSRAGQYDPEMFATFCELMGDAEQRCEVRELPVSELRPGMILSEDVKTRLGAVFVPRGYEITLRFIERARNFQRGFIKEPIWVIVPV